MKLDENNDNQISFEEFKRYLLNYWFSDRQYVKSLSLIQGIRRFWREKSLQDDGNAAKMNIG